MTAAERLKLLSGAGGTSAGARLRRIGGAAATAGALLVAYSGLPTGTAAQHLLTDRIATSSDSGGGGRAKSHQPEADDYDEQRERNNRIAIQTIIALVASGALN